MLKRSLRSIASYKTVYSKVTLISIWVSCRLMRKVQDNINDLKELGYINKEHSKMKGEWQLLK